MRNLSRLFGLGLAMLSLYAQAADRAAPGTVFSSDVRGALEMQARSLIANRPVRMIVQLSENAVEGKSTSRFSRSAPMSSPKASVRSARDRLKLRLQHAGVQRADPIGELPLMVVEAAADQIDELVAKGEVAEVFEDLAVPPALSESTPWIGATPLHNLGARGEGVTVAILDTGVQSTHPFLVGKVIEEACYSSTSFFSSSVSLCPGAVSSSTATGSAAPCAGVNGCDHGTHVAGIAAGRATVNHPFNGVAPDARIFAIQVFSRFNDSIIATPCKDAKTTSPCILTYTSDQIRALERVRDRRAQRNIVVANMSLGGGKNTASCGSDPRASIINELRNAGVATVVASGNEGYRDAVGAPGCITSAITVGSTTKTDAVSTFSNVSPLVDVLAPGSSIFSSVTGSGFGFKSGTSMATPQVAGAIALLRSTIPSATVNQMETALKNTGAVIAVPATNPAISKPRIQVQAALTQLNFVPASGQLYRLSSGGQIDAFAGAACSTSSCNSWTPLDKSLKTVQLAAAGTALYQLHNDGMIWRFTGKACANGCPGWQRLGNNVSTKLIAAGGSNLYQLRTPGSIWQYTGAACSGSACSGWQQLDENPLVSKIVASGSGLYKLHNNGSVWRYMGLPCSGGSCTGWEKLEDNTATLDIIASGSELYQLQTTGNLLRFTGVACESTGCSGWQKLDSNNNIKQITAGGNNLYQRQANGSIWKYTGTPCRGSTCSGWTRLDNNPLTIDISASASGLYQRHSNGNVWRHTGVACTGNACPGWEAIGNNSNTSSLSSAQL